MSIVDMAERKTRVKMRNLSVRAKANAHRCVFGLGWGVVEATEAMVTRDMEKVC